MSCIYRRGSIYWYRTRISGKNQFQSLKTTDRAEAEKLQIQLDYRYKCLGRGETVRITLPAALNYYLQQRLTLKDSTRNRYDRFVSMLSDRLKHVPAVQDLTVHHVNDLARDLMADGYAGKTIKEILSLLASTLKLLFESDLIDDIPVRKMPTMKAIPVRPETLGRYTDTEIQDLRRYIAGRLPAFLPYFLMFIYTGARKGELMAIRIRDVDLDQGQLRIRNEKTGRDSKSMYRTLEIHPEIARVILEHCAGKSGDDLLMTEHLKHSRNWMLRCIDEACRCARVKPDGSPYPIPYRRLHGLRHTFISSLFNAGIPPLAIMAMAGHTSIETTMRYSHIDRDDLKGKIRKLGY